MLIDEGFSNNLIHIFLKYITIIRYNNKIFFLPTRSTWILPSGQSLGLWLRTRMVTRHQLYWNAGTSSTCGGSCRYQMSIEQPASKRHCGLSGPSAQISVSVPILHTLLFPLYVLWILRLWLPDAMSWWMFLFPWFFMGE